MKNYMPKKESDSEKKKELGEGETYFSYYLKQKPMWISILLSMFLLLDIITIFVKISYFTKKSIQ